MPQSKALSDGLMKKEYRIRSADGTEISVWRIAASNKTSTCSPAVVHAHGGGFILRNLVMETVDLNRFRLKPLGQEWLKESGIVLLYVAYRIATEKPFPAPGDDVYAAFQWAVANAAALKIDQNKVGLMGFSAGGNLALYAALRAKGDSLAPPPKAIMLIYPMLDPDTRWKARRANSLFKSLKMWREKRFLKHGWDTYLNGSESLEGQKDFARLLSQDCTGLPPTYVDFGTEDYFMEEDVSLIENLEAAGVDVTEAKWEGMRHGFEGEKRQSKQQMAIVRDAQQARQKFWQIIFSNGINSRS